MFLNLLQAVVDPALKDKKIPIGEAAIDALVGFCVVFAGIALLVFIVWATGKVMQNTSRGGKKKNTMTEKIVNAPVSGEKAKASKTETVLAEKLSTAKQTDDLDDETIAVITAAIAAAFEAENRSCGFVVKRIRRM